MVDERLICFDLDGLYFTEQSFQKFKESIAPNIESSKRDSVFALSDQMKSFKTWNMSESDYRNWSRKELWLSCTNKEIYQKLSESYEVNHNVDQLAKDLKKQWYRLWICSNNFPTRIRELNNKFHFLEKFDIHVFSFEVWFIKPDPRIFQILIDKSGISPNKIIYSDDKEEKLQWAKSLWIQTFVFHDFNEFVQYLKSYWIEV